MNFDRIVTSLFKDDHLKKELKKSNIYTDDLNEQVLAKGVLFFRQKQIDKKQQELLKTIMKIFEDKNSYTKKFKMLCLLIQISKETKYDIGDILIQKKLKVFTKSNKNSIKVLPILDKNTLEEVLHEELLIPLYNFLMKLCLNEELYLTCLGGEIPKDEIFRRGTKIRFIWIFKIYNLIHILVPILESLSKFIKTFPNKKFFSQVAEVFYLDVLYMNNFVITALEEAAEDNYILMPYFDMLQFYESLTEQFTTLEKINALYDSLRKNIPYLKKPRQLGLTKEQIQEIEVQALRVKLISNSLKNPKKDHTRLETEYNVKAEHKKNSKKGQKNALQTEGNDPNIDSSVQEDNIQAKYLQLDTKKPRVISEDEEESSQSEGQEKAETIDQSQT